MKGPFRVTVIPVDKNEPRHHDVGRKRGAIRDLDGAIKRSTVGTKGDVRDADGELVAQAETVIDADGNPATKWLEL